MQHIECQITWFLQWDPWNYLMLVQLNWVSFSKTDNQTKTTIHGSPDVLGFIFQNGHSRIQHLRVQFTGSEIMSLKFLNGSPVDWVSLYKTDNQTKTSSGLVTFYSEVHQITQWESSWTGFHFRKGTTKPRLWYVGVQMYWVSFSKTDTRESNIFWYMRDQLYWVSFSKTNTQESNTWEPSFWVFCVFTVRSLKLLEGECPSVSSPTIKV